MQRLTTIATRKRHSRRPPGDRQSALPRARDMHTAQRKRPPRLARTAQIRGARPAADPRAPGADSARPRRRASDAGRPAEPARASRLLHEDELLTVATAAELAGRSLRTIRRAYRAGALLAYRDGNGRGVRIRYGDLRRWMMATSAAAPRQGEAEQPPTPFKRLEMRGKTPAEAPSENLALLKAARAERRRGGVAGGGAPRRVAGSAAASRA